ncbi:MAG TPA: geranylgeranyl reductase family protein [Thermomonospora sp.]|nr:geranylgeranyl reductase family protein [Thermomonospora sp.]
MEATVAVIGAGPAGAAAALRLARRGVPDVLLLDRGRFPRDKTCGSALSPSALRVVADLGLGEDVARLGYPVRALVLTTPGGRTIRVETGQAATILSRRRFDALLVDHAVAGGVRFVDGFRATELLRSRPGGRVRGLRGVRGGERLDVASDVVLCADGAHSVFSRDPRPRRTLITVMGWWEEFPFEPHTLEMIFDRNLAPLYGWVFPEDDRRVNIGICVDRDRLGRSPRNARELFQRFLADHLRDRLRGARRIGRLQGHPIAHTTLVRHATAPGALYLGEAARLTNHATGEGIFQALRSGAYAADAASDVVLGVRGERAAWRDYQARCRRHFTPGFLGGLALRAGVRGGALEVVALAADRPALRRLATRVLGTGLTGTSPSATRTE